MTARTVWALMAFAAACAPKEPAGPPPASPIASEPRAPEPEPKPPAQSEDTPDPEPEVVSENDNPGLGPPTEAEFKAWSRKDPAGEQHLYKWDKANLKRMLGYWGDLVCFRGRVKRAGEKAFGAPPGTDKEQAWFQFKRGFIMGVNRWQQQLFTDNPRVLEKSKLIGRFLEAHELLMHSYPKAYNEADRTLLERNEAHWTIVESKIGKYVKQLGGTWPTNKLSNKSCAAKLKKLEQGTKKKKK